MRILGFACRLLAGLVLLTAVATFGAGEFGGYEPMTGDVVFQSLERPPLSWKPFELLNKQIENGHVPLEREIITPVAVARVQQLEKVFSRDINETAVRAEHVARK